MLNLFNFNRSKDQSELKESSTRRTFLRTSVITASVLAPASLLLAPQLASAAAANSSHFDAETAFKEIMDDENAHVAFLKEALTKAGVAVRPKPNFKGLKQSDKKDFLNLSQTFENTGVGAYLLAAPFISSKAYLAAAGSILTIEARHAGFLDALLKKPLAPNGAFDKPLDQASIVNAVSPFIADLNGGSDPAAALNNDGDILNFALLLEYLEAEFYNDNVPVFYQ